MFRIPEGACQLVILSAGPCCRPGTMSQRSRAVAFPGTDDPSSITARPPPLPEHIARGGFTEGRCCHAAVRRRHSAALTPRARPRRRRRTRTPPSAPVSPRAVRPRLVTAPSPPRRRAARRRLVEGKHAPTPTPSRAPPLSPARAPAAPSASPAGEPPPHTARTHRTHFFFRQGWAGLRRWWVGWAAWEVGGMGCGGGLFFSQLEFFFCSVFSFFRLAS